MAKQYEMRFDLNSNIDPKLMRAFDTLSDDVLVLGRDVDSLKKTKGLRGLTEDAEQAKGAFHELRENAREFGDVFERTLQFTGARAVIDTVTGMFGNMISEVGALYNSVHQMGAATGATAREMVEFKDIAKELYQENLGEGFSDIGDALVRVRQVTGQAGDALEETTKNALIYRDVFGEDIPESIKTVDTMMKNFGMTSDQAYNLLAQGAQNGLNKSGELLDTANEYSAYFAKLGFGADKMFDTFSAGLQAGAFNLDKVGDGIKEFGIRTKDGSKASIEAYKTIGLNGKEMTAQFAKGGEIAQKAFLKTVQAINSVQDPAIKNAAAVSLFGTQAEDLEDRVIKAYGNIRQQFDMTKDTMKQIGDVKYSSLTKEIQGLGRELMTEVVIPIGEDLMPVLRDMTDWAKDNKDLIKTLALGVPAGLLAKNSVSMVKDFGKVGKSLFDTTSGVSKFGKATAMLTSPVGIAIGTLGLITGGLIAYNQHQKEARLELLNMGDDLKKSFDDYGAINRQTTRTQELTVEYDRLMDKINDTKTPAVDLTEVRRKLAKTEQELIDLNPEILSAEDAKSEKFRDQIKLANELNETKSKMQRRDLETDILDKESQLPDLTAEYSKLSKSVDEQEKAYDQARTNYVKYYEFMQKQEEIIGNTTGPLTVSQEKQLQTLTKELYNATGIERWGDLSFETEEMKKQMKEAKETINTTNGDMLEAQDTYQSLYDSQIKLIEMQELGGSTIQEQAGKYKDLSAEQKKQLEKVLNMASLVNVTMDDIPLNKVIDITAVWKQIGKEDALQLNKPGRSLNHVTMEQFADGGIATKPSIFGEAGPEIAIPLDNRPRSQGLLDQANRIMGRSPSYSSSSADSNITVTYSPNFTITGVDSNNIESQAKKVAEMGLQELRGMLKQINRADQRRSLTTI